MGYPTVYYAESPLEENLILAATEPDPFVNVRIFLSHFHRPSDQRTEGCFFPDSLPTNTASAVTFGLSLIVISTIPGETVWRMIHDSWRSRRSQGCTQISK
jgi:hypothetical protein